MTELRQAAQAALEALHPAYAALKLLQQIRCHPRRHDLDRAWLSEADKVIRYWDEVGAVPKVEKAQADLRAALAQPPAPTASCEPVVCNNTFSCRCPKHYTAAPAQRQPLSDEQIAKAQGDAFNWLAEHTNYSGGMGGETWDQESGRAVMHACAAAWGVTLVASPNTGEASK